MADEPEPEGAPDDDATVSPPRDFIAENLRALFSNAELEPLPPELQALLDRLGREGGP